MTLINAINSLQTYDLSQTFGGDFTDVPMFNNGTSFVTVTKAAVVSTPLPPQRPRQQLGKTIGLRLFDTNHNGVMDGDDYPIAGARVSIMQAGSSTPLATVYSCRDGSYHFNNLAAGTFSVSLETPGNGSGQDSGNGQMVLDKTGTVVNMGTDGTAQQDAYSDISLGDGTDGDQLQLRPIGLSRQPYLGTHVA